MSLSFVMLRRQFSSSSKYFIKHVTVIGGGIMGTGIAQLVAQNGVEITLVEVNGKQLKKAEETIKGNVRATARTFYKDDDKKQEEFMTKILPLISGTTNLTIGTRNTDLIIETISENLEQKQKLFNDLDEKTPESTIFATNTSSFSISDIASGVSRKDRFAGMHFFNPAYIMKLVEMIRIPQTSDQTCETLMEFGRAMGKTCIICKDTPGFVVNRLLLPYVVEAIKMLERGDATMDNIDSAMKLGANMLMGPIELSDFIGLHIVHDVLSELSTKYPNYKSPENLTKLIAEGKLGRISGEGFYKYNNK